MPITFRARVPFVASLLTAALAAGCLHRPPVTPVGLTLAEAAPAPAATLVWVGRGLAERATARGWERAPTFDYEFSVEQRRFADHWESVKTLRRVHPGYDGSAGPRLQVYVFRIDLAPAVGGAIDYRVTSTLGPGHGHADREFRAAQLELDADVSRFAPFDRYRITQHYQYEQGALSELVELLDGDAPWVRNHEEARLFAATPLAGPPTVATLGGW